MTGYENAALILSTTAISGIFAWLSFQVKSIHFRLLTFCLFILLAVVTFSLSSYFMTATHPQISNLMGIMMYVFLLFFLLFFMFFIVNLVWTYYTKKKFDRETMFGG